MKPFMDSDFLLRTPTARALFHETAAGQPICDFHCHVDAAVLAANKPFSSISEAWLGGDHYKWRAMRQSGVPERLITGQADPEEKFQAWAAVMPWLIGNPLYHWTHLELQRYFDIDEPLSPDSSARIWQQANDCLARPSWRPLELLRRLDVRLLCTTDDPLDDLASHEQLARDPANPVRIVPAFRPDKLLQPLHPEYPARLARLARLTNPGGSPVTSFESLAGALRQRVQYFHEHGCRLADHALDLVPQASPDPAGADRVFRQLLAGRALTAAEADLLRVSLLTELAAAYTSRGWTMQLHIGALRNTSTAAFRRLGPDSGYDAIRDQPVAGDLAACLNALEQAGCLPRTLLYSLNANDNLTLGTIAGTFQRDGQTNWVGLGPAWWFHDQMDGMILHLRQLCQVGSLAGFVGMTTDSRSLLSYTRHEYFRRILCDQIGTWVENGEYPADWPVLRELAERVSWKNARALFD